MRKEVSMHKLSELKDMLCEELEEYGSKDKLDVGGLDVVDKLAHAIKNIDKIVESSDYSMNDGMGGSSYYGRDNGQSRARGRNARRDSMGRYSSRYSRNSYESGVDGLVEEITDMMDELPEHIKKDAQRFVKKLEETM
jgi:hypothetical protein